MCQITGDYILDLGRVYNRYLHGQDLERTR
jgi:hypothetical protein